MLLVSIHITHFPVLICGFLSTILPHSTQLRNRFLDTNVYCYPIQLLFPQCVILNFSISGHPKQLRKCFPNFRAVTTFHANLEPILKWTVRCFQYWISQPWTVLPDFLQRFFTLMLLLRLGQICIHILKRNQYLSFHPPSKRNPENSFYSSFQGSHNLFE